MSAQARSHYPVWIDDARTAADHLRDAVALVIRARREPTEWPFDSWNDDLLSPRSWMLQVAGMQLLLGRFYLNLATDQARLT